VTGFLAARSLPCTKGNAEVDQDSPQEKGARMSKATVAIMGLLAITWITCVGCSRVSTPPDSAGSPLAAGRGAADSWTWQGYDSAGSRCVPHSSKAKLGTAAFVSKWHYHGSAILAGDVNGDGRPELVQKTET